VLESIVERLKPCEPVPEVENALRNSLLFFSIPTHILHCAIQLGKSLLLNSQERISSETKGIAFIQLIVKGTMVIERLVNHDLVEKMEFQKGQLFGKIDPFFDAGEFREAIAVTDCVLFMLPEPALKELQKDFSQFRQQLLGLGVMSFSEPLLLPEKSSTSQPFPIPEPVANIPAKEDLRDYPRIPLQNHILEALFSDESRAEIADVSVKGIFIRGACTGSLREPIKFKVVSNIPGHNLEMEVKGEIEHISEAGFGCEIIWEDSGDEKKWLELIVKITSLELIEIFRRKLTILEKPLSAHFVFGEVYTPGTLHALGSEGSILSSTTTLHRSDQLKIIINLALNKGKTVSLQSMGQVIDTSEEGYLVRFLGIDKTQQGWIYEFLDREEESEAPHETALIEISFQSDSDFLNRYMKELRKGNVILEKVHGCKQGQKVAIDLKLSKKIASRYKGPLNLLIKGTVVRITAQEAAVVRMDPLEPNVASRLENIVNTIRMKGQRRRGGALTHLSISSEMRWFVILGIFLPISILISKRGFKPTPPPQQTLRRTVEDAVKIKFIQNLKLEDKKIEMSAKNGAPYSLAEIQFVKYDPPINKYILFLQDKREIEVTPDMMKQFPGKLIAALLELNPSDVSLVVPSPTKTP